MEFQMYKEQKWKKKCPFIHKKQHLKMVQAKKKTIMVSAQVKHQKMQNLKEFTINLLIFKKMKIFLIKLLKLKLKQNCKKKKRSQFIMIVKNQLMLIKMKHIKFLWKQMVLVKVN